MNARLAPFGFEPEGRPYAAHLTMARVKDVARGVASRRAQDHFEIRPVRPCVRSRRPRDDLFRSQLSPKGARYESLLRVPFLYP